jgi:hypothetical protein
MTVPPGLIITAILVVKILRDLENDRKGNKRTLAVFLGRGGTQIEYLLCIQIAYLSFPWLPGGTGPLDGPAGLALAPAGGQIRPKRVDPDRPPAQRGVGRDRADGAGIQPAGLGGNGVWLEAENVLCRL